MPERKTLTKFAGSGLLLALALVLWLAAVGPAAGQADSLGGLVRQFTKYEQQGPLEKLFLHLDRPVYLCGETMWFKVYAVEGTEARPLALSSVAYVEVLDAQNRPVLQGKVQLKSAAGQGSFVVPTTLPSGNYTVRAYTNWMKNDDPQAYFHASITVINTSVASGAVAGKDSAAFDAQFFPEGGNLVQGLRSKVAFKVIGRAGRGVAAEGEVLNPDGQVVASFKTLRLGMGNFAFTPATAKGSYTAVLTLGPHRVITRKLPRVYEQGYVMRLENANPDYLVLVVNSTSPKLETIFLLGHSGQKIAVASQAPLINGQSGFIIKKSQLLDGVSHFTVFNSQQKPLCERLYFQPPRRQLAIQAQADKPAYTTRDKVGVLVSLADQPALSRATLSMAVYRLDSLNPSPAPSIDRYLWLTSELKGTVESPDYYFTATGPEAADAADNLMLTQGWSRFRWETILAVSPPALEYLPEPSGHVIRGQLTQAGTGLPRAGVMTYLSSPSRIIRLNNTLSDARGLVQFETNGFFGAQEIMAQTDPQQDSTSKLTIFDPFSGRYAGGPASSFRVAPRFEHDYAKRHLQSQVQNIFFGKYRNRYTVPPADSLAFYGPPDETYLLDKYTRFQVLEEVLREYVPGVLVKIRKDGYHLMVVNQVEKNAVNILKENPMVLLDGVPVFNINKLMAISPLKFQKLEVIDNRYFHGLAIYNGIVSFTTYQGDLGGVELDPRVLVQQYEGVQRQREFYAPRYDTPQEKQSRLPDLRNLLYWNPAVATGPNAQPVEFYTGDQAGRYLVVLQGLAANGLAGSSSFVLEVKPAL